MASRRQLKKDINYLTFELISECYTYQYFHKNAETAKTDEVVTSILDNRNNLIGRINHINGKNNAKLVKAHFASIRHAFTKSVEAMDQLSK